MPALRRPLPTTGYVVLGLLSFGRELTGYELKRTADDSIRFFFSTPAMSQIYDELERLQRLGLVRSRDDSRGADRARRAFRITPAGTRALQQWIDTDAPAPVIKHSTALRLFLGHLARPERLDALLREHEARTTALLEDLDAVRDTMVVDDSSHFAALVAEWSCRFYEGELEATRAAFASLRDRGDQESAGIGTV